MAKFGYAPSLSTDAPGTSKRISSDLVKYIIELSDFANKDEPEIYEQLYIWEADVGGAIDRFSTLVGQSYKGFFLKNVGPKLEPNEQRLLDLANQYESSLSISIPSYFELLTEVLMVQGNVFLVQNDSTSWEILPNDLVTVVDTEERKISYDAQNILMQENILYYQEGLANYEKEYKKGRFIHLKYKDTPTYANDVRGRKTFGIYSVSPLQRLVLPIWWKRITMIIDILWRFRNVPREHHKVKAELFSLDKYTGVSIAERRRQSKADADAYITEYLDLMKNMQPDQGIASLDTVEVSMIEPKRTVSYMGTNKLMDQLGATVWTALNIPPSVVDGRGAGSYASELVISNYLVAKVLAIAGKLKPVILDTIRAKIAAADSTLPVEKLDIKLELMLATSRLELLRQAAIMVSLGLFTESEMRQELGRQPLTEEERPHIVGKGANPVDSSVHDPTRIVPKYPDTPQSDVAKTKDPGQRTAANAGDET